MKKITMILVALSFLYSCKNQQISDNRIVIVGEIKGAEGEILTVGTFEELNRTIIAQDGTFHISVSHDLPFYFNFSVKNPLFQLYLEPGDSIYLYAEIEDFHSTFHASGSKEREAYYLIKKGNLFKELGSFYNFFELPGDQYMLKKDEYLAPFYDLISEMEAESGLNKNFLNLEQAYIEYFELSQDLIYPSVFRRSNGIPGHEPIDFPEQEITDKINSMDLDDPAMLGLSNYRMFIDRRTRTLQAEMYKEIPENEKNTSLWMKYMLLAADSLFKHPEVNSFAKYWFLHLHMTMSGPSGILDSYHQFLSDNTIPMYTQRLEKILQKWETLQPGSTIPDFTFTNFEGTELSLSDLKGKPTYILIWDTGCGPCRYEHSFWNQLAEEYNDRNMQFVTISFDRNKEEWLNYLTEKALSGIHLHQQDHFISSFANHFMIKGVPKFLVLDAEGKIFNAEAPRASAGIREVLDKLI
jgi:thiol-disulfide isomerase/thioredoxin